MKHKLRFGLISPEDCLLHVCRVSLMFCEVDLLCVFFYIKTRFVGCRPTSCPVRFFHLSCGSPKVTIDLILINVLLV